jgi:hypothetical protein
MLVDTPLNAHVKAVVTHPAQKTEQLTFKKINTTLSIAA